MRTDFFEDIQILPRGRYLQVAYRMRLTDNAIIRSNDPEEVLTHRYEKLSQRFIVPWRKVKGKLRRIILEKQRDLGISPECALKDDLCLQCPTCCLFGATGATGGAGIDYNLLSRVLGETAISETEVAEVSDYTANAVDEKTLTTGQALMTLISVPEGTSFLNVVTLRDPTLALTSILLDGLNRLTRLGASTREWGRIVTELLGYHIGDREVLTTQDLVANGLPKEFKADFIKWQLPEVEKSFREVNKQMVHMVKQLIGNKKKGASG
jgi:CRISPR type I-D-associated protein Csc2